MCSQQNGLEDDPKTLLQTISRDSYFVLLPGPDVSMTRPSARTTSKFRTFSRIVPYLTAFVPEALVEHIPHKLASAPGSENIQVSYDL